MGGAVVDVPAKVQSLLALKMESVMLVQCSVSWQGAV